MIEGGPLRIHVGKNYSNEMPGFYVIPFNFEIKELFDYFNENKNEMFRLRKKVINTKSVYRRE